MAARPSGLVSSGKALGGSREGVGSCGGQTNPSLPAILAAMGIRLLFPLLLLWTRGTQESELDPRGQHVCMAGSPSVELQCCPGWRQKDRECTILCSEMWKWKAGLLPRSLGQEVCCAPEQADLSSWRAGLVPPRPRGRGSWLGNLFLYLSPLTPLCPPLPVAIPRLPGPVLGPRLPRELLLPPAWPVRAGHRRVPLPTRTLGRPLRVRVRLRPPRTLQPRDRRVQLRARLVVVHVPPPVPVQPSGGALRSGHRLLPVRGVVGPPLQLPLLVPRLTVRAGVGPLRLPAGLVGPRVPAAVPVRARRAAPAGQCACPPGFRGARCELPCTPGRYGPQCRDRCEDPCPIGTFGEGCGSTCLPCAQGACDAVTGECVCNAGYWGPSCNTSCPSGFHGNNCSVPCECPEGTCHPVSGACQLGSHSQDAALIAGILVPLLLLLLAIACCACCCWAARLDPKDRPAGDGTALSRMKLQVWGALTSSLGSALPCSSLSSHKLPWVTVSHHDPEIPFNHSFIEPPSAGWASDDSFSSDPESGEEDEGMVPVAQAESPEASLAGGPFPPPEDASTPFAIPRTSSLARAKRPSVSFAEGTKFAPQSRRSSGELSSPLRKPKRLSRGTQPGPESQEAEEPMSPEQTETDGAPPGAASPRDSAIGRRRLLLAGRTVAERVEAIEGSVQEGSGSVTTIYMLAGTPQGSEGPVQSVLRRFGSFQKGQAEPRVKSAIPKPPRRALSRNKGSPGLAPGSASLSPSSAPKEELPGTLESAGTRPEEVARGLGDGTKSSGRGQELAPGDGPLEQDPQKLTGEEGQEEPQYENVVPISGPPDPRGP
ncbi:Scavenger receptor class F member 1 [Camelus dromedarius]|uniref:Scavenger receptor class F member 1 n=1 Tax=Camelus dromedarius TaxID=9838 RepID=A0A5N4D5A3_CAMDR|nr:Scavenger receptor class F member 1 [Camelus dromedarius]